MKHFSVNVAANALLALVLLAWSPLNAAADPPTPERRPLWPGPAPVGGGGLDAANAYLTIHRPDKPNGVAVVICPGGGYGGLVTDGEGSGIARWLNSRGITGIVLEYRLPAGRPMVPLLDAQRAVRTVRAGAAGWGVDPGRIGIIGFSAGGHLASTAATHFDNGDPKSADPVERVSCRPDFAILVYPVITMGEGTHGGSRDNLLGASPSPELIDRFSNEKQVTDRTSPTYLAHALDDRVVPPEHSRKFLEALRKHAVPAEYLELPSGGHGLNGYRGPMWDAWQAGVLKWLEVMKILPPEPTAADYSAWKHTGALCLLTTPEGANLPPEARFENFPVLVRLDKATFPFGEARPHGEDLRFSAAGRPLVHQIEEWDADRGTASLWVLFPVIRGGTRLDFTMHWENAEAPEGSDGRSVFQAGRYAGVLHLDESLRDELGVLTPANLGSTATRGLIGSARRFEAGQGILGGDHIKGYPFGDQPFTSEAWVRPRATGSAVFAWGRYATRLNGNTGDGNEVDLIVGSPPVPSWASDGPAGASGSVPLTMNQWHHLAATYEDGTSALYVDGVLAGTRHQPAAMSMMDDIYLHIGGMRGDYRYVGDIDEVRISRVARSAEWLRLQFENQKPMQSLVGTLVQPGDGFSVFPSTLVIPEGGSVTVKGEAGGARKVLWSLRKDGVDSVVAVDRFSYTLEAGRVVADSRQVLQFKAIYDDGVRTADVPVTVTESVPEPVFTLAAPASWNGRDPIEVVPAISNLAAMKAHGAGEMRRVWSVSGGAVIKEVLPDRLRLLRSQFTGEIKVTLAIDNGGAATTATACIQVTEPATDPWVTRTASPDEQPEDHQFYARDENNQGTLHFNGTVDPAVREVFLNLYADEAPAGQERQSPGPEGRYAFAVPLKAGLIRYRAEFGIRGETGDTVVRTVHDLVCGDAYIIQGQSNAEATGPNNGPSEDPSTPLSDWIRSYGNQYDGSTKGGWGQAVRTRIWGRPEYGDRQIGAWGMELARGLVERHHIPICILNGAVGGTRIDQHQRNEADHTDPDTIYGRLLARVRAARLTHGIRAVLWHQGENNQGAASPTGDYDWKSYQQCFIDVSAAWKQDYPNIRNYYAWQIWPSGCNMGGTHAGDMLLEVQRTLPALFSNLRVMSTLGVATESTGRGLCHFDLEGYAQIARLMSPLLEQDQYGLVPEQEAAAPNLRSAAFTSDRRDEIALDFGQPMAWKEEMKRFLYLDDAAAPIAAGSAAGTLLTLRLTGPSEATTIAYAAGRDWDGTPRHLLYGRNGIAALAFCDVAIRRPSPADYQTRLIEGWTIHLSEKLLAAQPQAVESALPFLQRQLQEIVRVVPAPAVARLRQVPLWFSPEYDGVPGGAEYHPGADWLRENGRNPAMVHGVEFSDARSFEAETSRMPNFTLHELAHAYHDLVLGFDQPEILNAYRRAKEAGLYERVRRRHGSGKPETLERAYAMTDHKEYFAELTEAFFSANDFFPFTRDELAGHDPEAFQVVRRVWGVGN